MHIYVFQAIFFFRMTLLSQTLRDVINNYDWRIYIQKLSSHTITSYVIKVITHWSGQTPSLKWREHLDGGPDVDSGPSPRSSGRIARRPVHGKLGTQC